MDWQESEVQGLNTSLVMTEGSGRVSLGAESNIASAEPIAISCVVATTHALNGTLDSNVLHAAMKSNSGPRDALTLFTGRDSVRYQQHTAK